MVGPDHLLASKYPGSFAGLRGGSPRVDFLFGSSVAGPEINLASPILSTNRAYKYRFLEAAGQGVVAAGTGRRQSRWQRR